MRCELREEEVNKCGGRPTEGLDLTALSAQRIAERIVRVRIGGQEGDLSVEGGFGVSCPRQDAIARRASVSTTVSTTPLLVLPGSSECVETWLVEPEISVAQVLVAE
jgi:hypothetical protein